MKLVNCVVCGAGVNAEVAVDGKCKVCQVKETKTINKGEVKMNNKKQELVVCVAEGCNAKMPESVAVDGKCPKCNGVSQYKKPMTRVRTGFATCGCGAQIPASKVQEWGGKCPTCNGTKQDSNKRVVDNKFTSKEEFNKANQSSYQVKVKDAVFTIPAAIELETLKYNMKHLANTHKKEQMVERLEKANIDFPKSYTKKQLAVLMIINRVCFLVAPE